MTRSNRDGLGAGEAPRQRRWRFPGLGVLIEVRGLDPKRDVKSLQQFSPVG
jgi:hypothetical protein